MSKRLILFKCSHSKPFTSCGTNHSLGTRRGLTRCEKVVQDDCATSRWSCKHYYWLCMFAGVGIHNKSSLVDFSLNFGLAILQLQVTSYFNTPLPYTWWCRPSQSDVPCSSITQCADSKLGNQSEAPFLRVCCQSRNLHTFFWGAACFSGANEHAGKAELKLWLVRPLLRGT